MTHAPRSMLLAAALAAAERGWPVFPLRPGDKRPAVRDWEPRATTDPQRILRCWTHAPYNVGIATGPAHLVVIDLDRPKGPEDVPPAEWAEQGVTDGTDVLALLCERHGQPLPCDTFTVRTWSGGTHLYFTAPDGEALRNTAGNSPRGLGWKVDTRAVGGLVVATGSTVQTRPYTVAHDVPAAPLPAWLAELLRPAPLPPQEPVAVPIADNRHDSYLRAAVNGELERIARAREGERNTALYRASVALGQLVAGAELTESEVTSWLAAAALRAGQSEREAQRTIGSGLRAGANRPRTVAA